MFSRVFQTRLTDAQIAAFYLLLLESGRERAAYHPCAQKSVAEYIEMVRATPAWWLILHKGETAGCFYLTDITGKCGSVHFAYLPPVERRVARLPQPVAMSRFMLASILYDRHLDGNFMMDTLIGKTPVWNRVAVKMLERSGGKVLGELPSACFCHDSGAMSGGIISYFVRENIPEEWARN